MKSVVLSVCSFLSGVMVGGLLISTAIVAIRGMGTAIDDFGEDLLG